MQIAFLNLAGIKSLSAGLKLCDLIIKNISNMKIRYKTLYFIALLAVSGLSLAQQPPMTFSTEPYKYKVLDSAYMKCTYQLTYWKDSTRKDSTLNDTQTLLIGKFISKYYSQEALDWQQYIQENFKNANAVPGIKNRGVWSWEIIKNYPQEKATVTDIGSELMGDFLYEEDLPSLNWKMQEESREILSYRCQKATVSFRGRDYIAWYAPEIPVDNGPWKFGGLPGLILKIYDTKENFIFECIGLETLKTKEPVKFYLLDYTKLKRQGYLKMEQRFHDDLIKYNNDLGIMTIISDPQTGKDLKLESYKLPFNPIELE
jgi:GLPGLI family protein